MARINFALVVILAGLVHSNVTNAAQSTGKPNQNSYFITGAVIKPGVYQIESSPSVLELITAAGGLSENHGRSAFIIRRSTLPPKATGSEVLSGSEYALIQIDLAGPLNGELEKDARLSVGDIVNIPSAEVFFVTATANTMSFPLRQGLTLTQALSLARGAGRTQEVVIVRGDPVTGKREEIKVDLREITSGQRIDIPIEANDIIVVPNSQTGVPPRERFLDAPPMQVPPPCRGARPCMAWFDFVKPVVGKN